MMSGCKVITNLEKCENDLLKRRNSCQKVKFSLKPWKLCMLSRQSQVNRNWNISRIERLAAFHHVENYQHDVQDLKCQGENIRNYKQPLSNAAHILDTEWKLHLIVNTKYGMHE